MVKIHYCGFCCRDKDESVPALKSQEIKSSKTFFLFLICYPIVQGCKATKEIFN